MPCDYSKYPKDWKDIRKRILERDGHCCKVCGVENYSMGYRDNREEFHKIQPTFQGDVDAIDAICEGFKPIKIVLTIAHLNHDINDNSDENLAALCQLHHNRHDVRHRVSTRREKLFKKKGQIKLFNDTQ